MTDITTFTYDNASKELHFEHNNHHFIYNDIERADMDKTITAIRERFDIKVGEYGPVNIHEIN